MSGYIVPIFRYSFIYFIVYCHVRFKMQIGPPVSRVAATVNMKSCKYSTTIHINMHGNTNKYILNTSKILYAILY